MKTLEKLLLGSLGAAALAGAAAIWTIAPGRSTAAQREPFKKRNIAHRGLHNAAAGIPENSLAAFRAAGEHGYGAEMDVRMSADGILVISHDASLLRMTGADLAVEKTRFEDMLSLRLSGTEERVAKFSEAIDLLCAYGVPACVEIKRPERFKVDRVCRAVMDVLDRRDIDYCVESFDPRVVAWFRRNAPDVLRGQLITPGKNMDGCSFAARTLAPRCFFNFLTRPHFISHELTRKTFAVRMCERLGAMRFCWTSHDRSAERFNDTVIFENYLPPVRYL